MDFSPADRRPLGSRLRDYRIAAGMTGAELARLLGTSQSRVSKIENGNLRVDIRDVRRWLHKVNAPGGAFEEVLTVAEQGEVTLGAPSGESGSELLEREKLYGRLEHTARVIHLWSPAKMPGLFQTAGYAKHELGPAADSADSAAEVVRARMTRQEVLSDPLVHCDLILGEAALRNSFGGRSSMSDQLARLAAYADFPSVDLRVLEFASGSAIPYWPQFTLYESAGERCSVVILENPLNDFLETRPEFVRRYEWAHARYREHALCGGEAVALVRAIAATTTG